MASLVADYGSSDSNRSSESESSDSEEINKDYSSKNTKPTEKLPTPDFNGGSSVKTSVFSNPFIEAENAKKAILEKHVKMVNTKDNTTIINGKKICWNYRKGRCRFGTKCSYAHDSDLQKTEEELTSENKVQQTVICQNQQTVCQPVGTSLNADEEPAAKKKKRPGLTQGLVPGKNVMKQYKKQKTHSGWKNKGNS